MPEDRLRATTIGAVRHPALLVSVLVSSIVIASCGSGSDKTRSTAATTTGRGASGAGSAKAKRKPESGFQKVQAKHPQLPALSGGAGFDRSMVRVSFINTSNPFMVKSAVVYFVTAASGTKALAQAKACVQAYLSKARSAYCFGFPSERTFRFSRVSPGPPAGIKKPCWSVYWGKPRGRRPIGAARNPSFGPLHCPAR
jgi:hypothetical protein